MSLSDTLLKSGYLSSVKQSLKGGSNSGKESVIPFSSIRSPVTRVMMLRIPAFLILVSGAPIFHLIEGIRIFLSKITACCLRSYLIE